MTRFVVEKDGKRHTCQWDEDSLTLCCGCCGRGVIVDTGGEIHARCLVCDALLAEVETRPAQQIGKTILREALIKAVTDEFGKFARVRAERVADALEGSFGLTSIKVPKF